MKYLVGFLWFLEMAAIIALPVYFFRPIVNPCAHRYLPLHERPVSEIRVVFGYKDTRPMRYVGDRYERIAFSERLKTLGFVMDAEDADLFTLTTPDKVWRLRLAHSSVGPDDDANRKDSFQPWQSSHASRLFYDGINESTILLYDGHSRDGGGPDFGPPKITSSRHIDYYWYRVQQPGLLRLQQVLAEAKTPTKVLGLFSCASDAFFSETVRKAQPGMALVSSRELIYHSDAMKNLEGLIRAVVGNFCSPAFESAVAAESKGGKTKIEGFLANE